MANKKLIKELRNVAFMEQRYNKLKQSFNNQLKKDIEAKEYEPLFDWQEETKLAKAKLVLLGVDINGT